MSYPMSRVLLHRRAFSVVELLVVIAIIAVLVGVLAPVIASVREAGRTVPCASNLRQLHAAFQMYSQDHGGMLPLLQNRIDVKMSTDHDNPAITIPADNRLWVRAFHPYVNNQRIWFCPSDTLAGRSDTSGGIEHKYSSYHTGLGFAKSIMHGTPLTLSGNEFPRGINPSASIMLTDNLWGISWGSAGRVPNYSHDGKFNYLFFDGHIRAYRQDDRSIPIGF